MTLLPWAGWPRASPAGTWSPLGVPLAGTLGLLGPPQLSTTTGTAGSTPSCTPAQGQKWHSEDPFRIRPLVFLNPSHLGFHFLFNHKLVAVISPGSHSSLHPCSRDMNFILWRRIHESHMWPWLWALEFCQTPIQERRGMTLWVTSLLSGAACGVSPSLCVGHQMRPVCL